MIVRVPIVALCNAAKAPTIHLTSEGRVAAMAEEERDDLFFKVCLVEDAPGATVREPRDNVRKFGCAQHHVKLHWKGWYLSPAFRKRL